VRLVHLSDLHLGFRAFPRRERGWNLRERDLATAFHRTVQEIARHGPDVVLISGDLFDHPDPPSTAFLTLSRGLTTLRGLLPRVTVLAIAGERDTPYAPADPGPVAVADALPGVEAAAGAPRAVHVKEHGLHALLVPHRAVLRPPFPELRPDPEARWNVLLLRGTPCRPEVSAVLPEVRPEGWDYVALGGTHRHQRWRPRVWSAGSLDRVGVNPWTEATEEKGFVVFDLAPGVGEFHPVPGRPVVDLAPVRVDPGAPEVGGRRLREVLDGIPGGIDGKIVRLRLQGPVDSPIEALPPGLLTAIERRAAYLEVRVEAVEERELPMSGAGAGGGRSPSPSRAASHASGRVAAPGSRPDAAPVPDPAAPARLRWQGGGDGELLLGPGLWALTSDSGPDRSRVVEALEAGNGGSGARPGSGAHPPLGTGAKPPVLQLVAARPIRLVSDTHGPRALLHRIREEQGRWATESLPVNEAAQDEVRSAGEGAGPGGGLGAGEPELRARLGEARADWVEAAGDLEARAMEWTRERQEAETRLQAYRDRARELRERLRVLEAEGAGALCPTCARPLAEAHPELVEVLREEWEAVVQDGRWWKRRRDQLEDRPTDLRELELRALHLHARVEALSQGLEETEEEAMSREHGTEGEASPSPEERALLRQAGELLRRVSEGEIQGVGSGRGGLLLLREHGDWSPPGPREEAILAAALHLAWIREVVPGEAEVVGLMAGLGGAEADPRAVRTLEIVATEAPPVPLLVVLSPALVSRCPELFRGTLELYRDGEGRLRFRSSPGGAARVRLLED
jgi:DNA repair protein SbcD/Mre11